MQKETNMGGCARPYGGQPQGGQTHSSVWTRFIRRMRTDRRTELLVYGGVALLVVVLYLFVSRAADGGATADADGVQVLSAANAADTETRLQEVLSCIRGAGRVEVMITYETGREIVPAMTTSVNSNGSETSDGDKSSSSQQSTESTQPATVSQSGSNAPIVLKEIEPVVRGVIVVADGAADVTVRLDLQRAVRAVLDIPLSHIEVFERSAQPTN